MAARVGAEERTLCVPRFGFGSDCPVLRDNRSAEEWFALQTQGGGTTRRLVVPCPGLDYCCPLGRKRVDEINARSAAADAPPNKQTWPNKRD